MLRRKIVTIVGTRPEVIKLAPVVREIERHPARFDHLLVATGQHREMLDQVLTVFGLKPDIDLDLMHRNQSLADFASRSLSALSCLLTELKPDLILIQGDTTTVMSAALAAFYNDVMIGHVEAGLRTRDKRNPFPEEINRRVASCLADFHFAPTERARRNLLAEGVREEFIFVTGNTIVDALKSIPLTGSFDDPKLNEIDFTAFRTLLVTAHRRESHGAPLKSICRALKTIAEDHGDAAIVYPVHLNPNVRNLVEQELGGHSRIHVTEPVSYRDLLKLIGRCYLILTDSGGIQEEAPSFHKPVLVLRTVTERTELVEAGGAKVVGTDTNEIVREASRLLDDGKAYASMARIENPFGDGHAAERIVGIIRDRL